jgi:pimeloyl-ACP methyl ester carboxylesterase
VILPSGAELRVTRGHVSWRPSVRATAGAAVVCVNGGQGTEVEGTWSATVEWLVRRLAPSFPRLAFAELRYRVKSWNRLEWCIDDAREAVRTVGAQRTLLLGFSMGGIVSSQIAAEPSVETVVGLAPWFPERLSLEPLRGRRLRVLHGSLDLALPGIPGVSPASSRRGFDRAMALGAEGEYTIVRGGVHGVALRAHWGRPVPLPRARTWARLVADELRLFQAPG